MIIWMKVSGQENRKLCLQFFLCMGVSNQQWGITGKSLVFLLRLHTAGENAILMLCLSPMISYLLDPLWPLEIFFSITFMFWTARTFLKSLYFSDQQLSRACIARMRQVFLVSWRKKMNLISVSSPVMNYCFSKILHCFLFKKWFSETNNENLLLCTSVGVFLWALFCLPALLALSDSLSCRQIRALSSRSH